MTDTKSPFLIVKNFISPLICEEIVGSLILAEPNKDIEGHPEMMTRHCLKQHEDIIVNNLVNIMPEIENWYGFDYKGTEQPFFLWYPAGSKGEPQCDNSNFLRGKWVRTKTRDFTATLFLSDYQEKTPFDPSYEVLGGKLEFPQHDFSFQPQRGVLVVYPCVPHFINAISEVLGGDLCMVRTHIAAEAPYLYNPTLFPGDYRSWFKE